MSSGPVLRSTFSDPVVWTRTLRIGLPVGLIQVVINQGDAWLAGHLGAVVITKSILSPLVSCSIAFVSAASARRAEAS